LNATKWAVVLLIPAAIFLTPVPDGVTIQGWRLPAVFGFSAGGATSEARYEISGAPGSVGPSD
jgi:hypothetical protein